MSGTIKLVKIPWLENSQIMGSESTTVSWLKGHVKCLTNIHIYIHK